MTIKIRKRTTISQEGFFFFLSLLSVSSYALLENVSVSIPAFSAIKMPLLYIAGVCEASYILNVFHTLKKKKYFYVILTVFLFCAALVLTVFFNSENAVGTNPRYRTIRLVLFIVELFLLMIWAAETNRSQSVVNFLFYYVLLLILLTDGCLLLKKDAFYYGRQQSYLIGSKFNVAYFHIDLLVLWSIKKEAWTHSIVKLKGVLYIGMPLILYISVYIDCMTGVVGCVALILLFELMNTPAKRKIMQLGSPTVLVVLLVASIIFPLLVDSVLSIPTVVSFIENILNRSTTLTGRLDIYQKYYDAMKGHWLWGYGYGNGYTISMRKFGYANAQNALLQWILQTGLVATGLLVILMVIVVNQVKRFGKIEQCAPWLIMIYLYVILGTVEVTFSMSFLLWIGVIFMLTCDKLTQKPEI